MKFSLREITGIFSTKIRSFQLSNMPKLLNFRFPEGDIFLIKTILSCKDPLKYFFFLFPNGITGRQWVKLGFEKKIKMLFSQQSSMESSLLCVPCFS